MNVDAPLRVILDDRPMRHALTGVGNYIAQLLLNLERFQDAYEAAGKYLSVMSGLNDVLINL